MRTLKGRKNYRENYNCSIFTKIYKNNDWGGEPNEFYSGPGSHHPLIHGYVQEVGDFIIKNQLKDIVEIGCGDFNIGEKVLKHLDSAGTDFTYIGYDVVKPLIRRNREMFGNERTKFICKDASSGIIKNGDVLIIRQVLQHLNNRAIQQIIKKFNNYRYIIVSEHQLAEHYGNRIRPNIDQVTSASIRLHMSSAIYLDKPPFNCNIIGRLYSIPEPAYGLEAAINTFIIKRK